MNNNKLHIACLLLLSGLSFGLKAQNIGINTTGAAPNTAAILDLNTGNAGTMGLLPEQVALTATNAAGPIVAPPTGLFVYNTATAGVSPNNVTPGYYFNAGTAIAPNWVQFVAGNSATNTLGGWLLNGNTGTNPATNFLGTIDAKNLIFKTNNTQWMTILSTGQVGIWNAAPPYPLTVTANGAGVPITYSSNSNNAGFGIWGANTAVAGGGSGVAIIGNCLQTGGSAIAAEMGNPLTNYYIASALSGTTDVSVAGGKGVIGDCDNATGVGVFGISAGASGVGSYGTSAGASGPAMEGVNTNASGTGIIGAGNNQPGNYLGTGSGGAFTGSPTGLWGFATKVPSGTGVIGVGNNTTINTLAGGSGGAFSGTANGILAMATANVNPSTAILCINTATGNNVFVDYWNGTNYKILGTSPGTVSCSVKDTKGNYVVMHAPETPEAYYEDYGQAQLVNGKVHVDMDPTYAKNICVNDKHPLRVYIQLEGDCKGVYVTNKTATGFDVVELNGGNSNVAFQYHIIGNQADAVMPSGAISKFADLRFEPTPVNPEVVNSKPLTVPAQQLPQSQQAKLSTQNPR